MGVQSDDRKIEREKAAMGAAQSNTVSTHIQDIISLTLLKLPSAILASVLDMLDLREIVLIADNTSKRLRERFKEVACTVRSRALDNREYCFDSLRWVLKRGVKIRSFTLHLNSYRHDDELVLNWACEAGTAGYLWLK